ncbi:MAG: PorP/SprF family type IX secretion system membrane protein, partial [Bacteroidales bacterium]
MKKLITALAGMLTFSVIAAQQIPISEGYFIDRYSFSPSYAGNYNPQFLFLDYRSDWTGINGGPKTFRMSYNDRFMTNSGYGAKLILDKAGIFNQLYFMGSYSYNLKVSEDHHILFGLSAGVYRNTINMREYYNDPTYNIDP